MNYHNFDVDITIPSSKQKIKINKDFIEVDQKKILCLNIEALKYGVSLIGNKKKPTNKNYSIEIKSYNGQKLAINFSSTKMADVLEEDHFYYYIMAGLWQFAKKQLANKLIEKLNNKETFTVGQIEVSNQGFTMPYKTWFWGKVKIGNVTWANSNYKLDKGVLKISAKNNGNLKAKLSIHNDWNAVVLNTLLHYLWQDGRKEKLADGLAI